MVGNLIFTQSRASKTGFYSVRSLFKCEQTPRFGVLLDLAMLCLKAVCGLWFVAANYVAVFCAHILFCFVCKSHCV